MSFPLNQKYSSPSLICMLTLKLAFNAKSISYKYPTESSDHLYIQIMHLVAQAKWNISVTHKDLKGRHWEHLVISISTAEFALENATVKNINAIKTKQQLKDYSHKEKT